MNSEVKWIKIVVDIFDDEKISLIETMPDADSLIVIWFKLLCLAGKQNNKGVFTVNERIPYTAEMFAAVFHRPINTIKLAIEVFERYGMVEVINGVVTIPNWEKHQSLDSLEASKLATRNRVAKYRERQKMLTEGENIEHKDESDEECNVTETLRVTQCNADRVEVEEEVDKEKKKKNSKEESNKKNESIAVFRIPLNDGTMYNVTQAEIDQYKSLYPNVNVEQEFRNIVGWNTANPSKRKTLNGIGRHINSWLADKQNNPRRNAVGFGNVQRQQYIPVPNELPTDYTANPFDNE